MILNSGVGSRLKELTKDKPKALLELAGKPLLGHQIDRLLDLGIDQFIITTGPFEERIKNYLREVYPNLNVVYVKNSEYKSTNYIYSMFLAAKEVDDDIVLLHGDLVFNKQALEKLLKDNHENCVLVNKDVPLSQKDFKAILNNRRVVKIGIEFFGQNAFFCLPLYKFSKKDFRLWLREIQRYVESGNLKVYAENALNDILNSLPLFAVYFNQEICFEVDTLEDYEYAKSFKTGEE